MKKVLFATTALVATAGVASADVALSGSAEMGVFSESSRSITLADDGSTLADVTFGESEGEVAFHTHVDVNFSLSGSTDSGLTFGASVDLDEADNINGDNEDGVAVFISGDFGTLTLGDTDGAFDAAMPELDLAAGSIFDDHTAHVGFQGNSGLDGFYDGQILRYDYTYMGFGIHFSVELDDSSEEYVGGIAATYSGELGAGLTLDVGLGYQMTEGSDTILSLTAGQSVANPIADDFRIVAEEATIHGIGAVLTSDAGFSVGVNYSHLEYDNLNIRFRQDLDPTFAGGSVTSNGSDANAGSHERTFMSIGVGYEFDAIALTANYGTVESDGAADVFDATGYGFAAEYDLGGGLSLQLGVGHSDYDTGQAFTNYSFGASMSF